MSAATIAAGVDFGDSDLAGHVRDRISLIETLIGAELGDDLHNGIALLNDAVRPAGSGCRRIRPLIAVMCAQLGPSPDAWQVTVAGAATEMVHLATLHHDNVVNDSRDGGPSRARWRNSLAILAGDYLLATASRLLSRLGPVAVAVIAETFGQMTEAQMFIRRRIERDESFDQALPAVWEKTGSLITTAGRLGALFGGVPEAEIDRTAELAGRIGIALQISDDVTDIAQFEQMPGSSIDLRRRLGTLPALYALQESGPRADRLRRLLLDSADSHTHNDAVALIRESGGMTRAIELSTQYAADAATELLRLPESPGRYALDLLVDYLRSRH
ncbi:MAG: polyprenyl synthetase family protein [Mycobacterium sp.]